MIARRGGILLWLLGAIVVVGAAGYWFYGRSASSHAKSTPPTTPTAKAPVAIAVTVAPVTKRPIERTVSIVGTLRGFDEIVVSTVVDGRVRSILHDVGDVVPPGEVLLDIDDSDYRLAAQEQSRALDLELSRLGLDRLPDASFDVSKLPSVQRARIVEENAAQQLERFSQLVSQNVITKDEYEKAELNLRTARLDVEQRIIEANQSLASVRHRSAMLATANKKLDDVRVIVPDATALAGEPQPRINLVSTPPRATGGNVAPAAVSALTIAERFVSEGEIVRAAQPTQLFRLVVEDPLKLEAAVPERFAGKIRVGQPVRLAVEAYPDQTFAGLVARVNPTVAEASRTFAIEVSIANPDRSLKAGSFATASILTGRDEQTVTVPEESIIKFAGVTKVFVVEGDRVRAVPVEVGQRLDVAEGKAVSHWVEVHGLSAADAQVVTAGHSQLSDGSTVRVRSGDALAESSSRDLR